VTKERVIVLSVVQQHLSKAETARRYQVSWRWVHTLVTRYQTCGTATPQPTPTPPPSKPLQPIDPILRTTGSAPDHVDRLGKIGLRRAGRMHHLGVGAAQAGSPVTILTDAATVTVIHQDTGEVLSNHTIDPDRSYWRNQHKPPGRWPVRYGDEEGVAAP
jgi:hypothetical protein